MRYEIETNGSTSASGTGPAILMVCYKVIQCLRVRLYDYRPEVLTRGKQSGDDIGARLICPLCGSLIVHDCDRGHIVIPFSN